jgi:hypothetical protein
MHKFVLCLVASLVFSFNAFSQEEILSVTDNDDNTEIYKLVVKVDKKTQSLKEIYKDTYSADGVKIKRTLLSPTDLTTDNGVIMEERDGYNVLNLKSDNFDHVRGGRITIDTLYNGATGERREYDVELAKDKMGWKLFNGKKVVTKFHIKVNRVIMLGVVGIRTFDME